MGLISKVVLLGGVVAAAGVGYLYYKKKQQQKAAATIAAPATTDSFAKPKTATQSILEVLMPKGSTLLTDFRRTLMSKKNAGVLPTLENVKPDLTLS